MPNINILIYFTKYIMTYMAQKSCYLFYWSFLKQKSYTVEPRYKEVGYIL